MSGGFLGELLLDAVLDTLKALPFLFLAFLVIEFLEQFNYTFLIFSDAFHDMPVESYLSFS